MLRHFWGLASSRPAVPTKISYLSKAVASSSFVTASIHPLQSILRKNVYSTFPIHLSRTPPLNKSWFERPNRERQLLFSLYFVVGYKRIALVSEIIMGLII